MRFLRTSLATTSLFFTSVHAGVLKRLIVVSLDIPFSTIVEPADGSSIAAGQLFPLDYPVSFYPPCPTAVYPLQFFLLDHIPTAEDVDTNPTTSGSNWASIRNPSYQFGNDWEGWIEPGSPPTILDFPLPPSNFTMPELSVPDGEIYFVVAELFSSCPGHGAFIDVGVSYSAIRYSGSTATKRDEVATSDATALEYGL